MDEINRMANPIVPERIEEARLADPEVLECPYPTYDILREQAPVWQDPLTGLYVITRYDDLRAILVDTDTYSNWRPSNDHANLQGIARTVHDLFEEKGWVPAASLAGRDDPEHKQMRAMFDKAFRAGKIKEMDPFVEQLAYGLFDDFIEDGHCDFVRQYAVPLPLTIICRQMGAPDEASGGSRR